MGARLRCCCSWRAWRVWRWRTWRVCCVVLAFGVAGGTAVAVPFVTFVFAMPLLEAAPRAAVWAPLGVAAACLIGAVTWRVWQARQAGRQGRQGGDRQGRVVASALPRWPRGRDFPPLPAASPPRPPLPYALPYTVRTVRGGLQLVEPPPPLPRAVAAPFSHAELVAARILPPPARQQRYRV